MSDHNENNDHNHNSRGENFIDYRTLEIKKSRVKFFNDHPDKNFGFVTVLDANDKPQFDAFLSGTILEKAGIYPPLEKDDILYVRHVTKPKGEAVVFVQRKEPNSGTLFGNANRQAAE